MLFSRRTRRLALFAIAFALCTILPTLTPGVNSAEQDSKTFNTEVEKGSGKGPLPGLQPLDQDGRMRISESDRCPVCAMRPIKYPKTSCAIQLKDGRTYYFCATGCMIRAWMHPDIFLGVDKGEPDRPVVREYFTGRQLDARELKWVGGSDIVGPMGPALVPVSGEKELEAFIRRHGGKTVFTLGEMDDARWHEITGRPPR